MRSLTLSALALVAQTAYGYVNTSPFFMWSTSQVEMPSDAQLSSAESLTNHFNRVLSRCPSQYYIIVSQPGVTSKDFQSKQNVPKLASYLSSGTGKTQVLLNDVVGVPDVSSWSQTLSDMCSANSVDIDAQPNTRYELGEAKVINVRFQSPAKTSGGLASNDALLAKMIEQLPSQDYTVLYTTAAKAQKASHQDLKEQEQMDVYVMETPAGELFHTELKRDLSAYASKEKSNQTMIDGPLFDKYQFLTPGIFMGFLTGFILVSILYVGLSALTSLKVTYAAFDKDMSQQSKKTS